MADPTNDHEAQARARKVAKLYKALRAAGATSQTVRYFSYTGGTSSRPPTSTATATTSGRSGSDPTNRS
jgi:hypothetical protein